MNNLNNPTPYNEMQLVKRRFFAMRNGVVADALRKGGSPYQIIFGVNLPQLREIAADFAPAPALAQRLWADTRTRESQLLAPWLIPGRKLNPEDAVAWLKSAVSAEAVDILCIACLRNFAEASQVATTLADTCDTLGMYAALRLLFNNLSPDNYALGRELISRVGADSPMMLRGIARQLADEIDWLSEE